MAKSTYAIKWVRKDLLSLWHQLWNSEEPSKEAIAANANGSLSQVDFVEARNLQEAIAIVRKRRPDCAIIEDACHKVG